MSYIRREIPNGTRIVMDDREFGKAVCHYLASQMDDVDHHLIEDAHIATVRSGALPTVRATIDITDTDDIIEIAKVWEENVAGAPRIPYDEDGVAVEFGDEGIVITFTRKE